MAKTEYAKERIALFTQYFYTNNKPISVEQLIDLFEKYSGVRCGRQTIYSDLNAIETVFTLSCKTKGTSAKYWYRVEDK